MRWAALLLLFALVACQEAPPPRDAHENLNATLWMQSAAEYKLDALGKYRQAKATLDRAIRDRRWTAAVEQTGDVSRLPLAVIMDLDETVLDNSLFQGELTKRRTVFNLDLWNAWVARAEATALPGALDFIAYAESRGVTVFYVTNRTADGEAATRRNLEKLGVKLPASIDTVLTAGEKPGWTSEKTSRRTAVAATHRILMLVGDDLGDFIGGSRDAPENRLKAAERHAEWWGERWVLLANPAYGSWEAALYGRQFSLPENEILRQKWEKLTAY